MSRWRRTELAPPKRKASRRRPSPRDRGDRVAQVSVCSLLKRANSQSRRSTSSQPSRPRRLSSSSMASRLISLRTSSCPGARQRGSPGLRRRSRYSHLTESQSDDSTTALSRPGEQRPCDPRKATAAYSRPRCASPDRGPSTEKPGLLSVRWEYGASRDHSGNRIPITRRRSPCSRRRRPSPP